MESFQEKAETETKEDPETGLVLTSSRIRLPSLTRHDDGKVRATLGSPPVQVVSCEVEHPGQQLPLWVKAMLNIGCKSTGGARGRSAPPPSSSPRTPHWPWLSWRGTGSGGGGRHRRSCTPPSDQPMASALLTSCTVKQLDCKVTVSFQSRLT